MTTLAVFLSKVDFETMEILEPSRRPIRRTFHPGVWVQFNQSAHEIQLHSKINDIQVCVIYFKYDVGG